MTIEQEAREIVLSLGGVISCDGIEGGSIHFEKLCDKCFIKTPMTHIEEMIIYALKTKQDRIDELESYLDKWSVYEYQGRIKELENKLAEYHDSYEGKKHRIYELEGALNWAFEQFAKIQDCHLSCEQLNEQEEREVHHMFRLAQEGIQFIKDAKKALGGGK